MLERFWESKEKLAERLNALENEIATLKSKLQEADERKEDWFRKKEDLKLKIQEAVKQVREIKVQKDNSGEDIRKLKIQRNEYNKIVGQLISKVKLLNKERDELYKKKDVKKNPVSILTQIENMERRIETEVISFSQEQKLMKLIKKLKNEYSEMSGMIKLADHIRQLSNEIEQAKSKAQEFHRKIQEYSKKEEDGFNEFIETSRNVNNIRQEQEKAFKKFVEHKRLYILINNELKNKISEAEYIRGRIAKFKVTSKDREIAELKERLKYVEEKIKNGEKLTTEDLLVFQKGESAS